MTAIEVNTCGPKVCLTFEPQAWRKTICKNCFQPPAKHTLIAESEGSDSTVPSRSMSRKNSSEAGKPESVSKLSDKNQSQPKSSLNPDKTAALITERYEQLEKEKNQSKEFSNTLPRTKGKCGVSSITDKYATLESSSGIDDMKTNIPPQTRPKIDKNMPASGTEILNSSKSKFGSVENISENDRKELLNSKLNKFGSMENISIKDNRKEPIMLFPKSKFGGSVDNLFVGHKMNVSELKSRKNNDYILNKFKENTKDFKSGIKSKFEQTINNKEDGHDTNVKPIAPKHTDEKLYCDKKENDKARVSNDSSVLKSMFEATAPKSVSIDTYAQKKLDSKPVSLLKLSMPEIKSKQSNVSLTNDLVSSIVTVADEIKAVPDALRSVSTNTLKIETNRSPEIVNDNSKRSFLSFESQSQSSKDVDGTGAQMICQNAFKSEQTTAISKTTTVGFNGNLKSPTPEKDKTITWKLQNQLETSSSGTETKPEFKKKDPFKQSSLSSVTEKENTSKHVEVKLHDQLKYPITEKNETPALQQKNHLISPGRDVDKSLELQSKDQPKDLRSDKAMTSINQLKSATLEKDRTHLWKQTNQLKSPLNNADKKLDHQAKQQPITFYPESPFRDKYSNLELKDKLKSQSMEHVEEKRKDNKSKNQLSSNNNAQLGKKNAPRTPFENKSKQDTEVIDKNSKYFEVLLKSNKARYVDTQSQFEKTIPYKINKEERGKQSAFKLLGSKSTSANENSKLMTTKEEEHKVLKSKRDDVASKRNEKNELGTKAMLGVASLQSNKDKQNKDVPSKFEKSSQLSNKDDKTFDLRCNLRDVKELANKDIENLRTKSKFELPSLKPSKIEHNDIKAISTKPQVETIHHLNENAITGSKFKISQSEKKERLLDKQHELSESHKYVLPNLKPPKSNVSAKDTLESKTDLADGYIQSAGLSKHKSYELHKDGIKLNDCLVNKSTLKASDSASQIITHVNSEFSSKPSLNDSGKKFGTKINEDYDKNHNQFHSKHSCSSDNFISGLNERNILKKNGTVASGINKPHFDNLSKESEVRLPLIFPDVFSDIDVQDTLPLHVDTQVSTSSRNTTTNIQEINANPIETYDNLASISDHELSNTNSHFKNKNHERASLTNGDISDMLPTEKIETQVKNVDPGRTLSLGLSENDIEKLKSELLDMTERCQNLETENEILSDGRSKLEVSATEHHKRIQEVDLKIKELLRQLKSWEDKCLKLESETTLLNNNKTSHSKILNKETEESDKRSSSTKEKLMENLMEENEQLKQDVTDMKAEMEEMYDAFRDQEAEEFRELQKELEYTSKNCRIMQFKIRKLERQCQQLEQDKNQFEERLRTLQNQFQDTTAVAHIRALEDELRKAKEVSVHLHDDLDLMEDKQCKVDDENRHLTELLEQSDRKQFRLELQVDKLRDKIVELRSELHAKGGNADGEPRKLNCAEFLALHRGEM